MDPNELIAYFDMLLEYAANNAQNMNQASQQALGQLISQLQELITQIIENGQGVPPISTAPNGPIPQGRPSSNVKGMSYDDRTGNMLVQFLGKHPNENGSIYSYPNTPPEIAELLQAGAIPARTKGKNAWGSWFRGKVPSAGASVFTLLKNRNVPYQRLS